MQRENLRKASVRGKTVSHFEIQVPKGVVSADVRRQLEMWVRRSAEYGFGGIHLECSPRIVHHIRKVTAEDPALEKNNYLRDWWMKRSPGSYWKSSRNTSTDRTLAFCT